MNRFLGLPTTGAQLHRAVRDFWLRKAALLLTDGAELDIARLHQEFSTFITRGAWPSWRKLDLPPENASELRRALFFAAKFSDGETLCPRQMYRRLT